MVMRRMLLVGVAVVALAGCGSSGATTVENDAGTTTTLDRCEQVRTQLQAVTGAERNTLADQYAEACTTTTSAP